MAATRRNPDRGWNDPPMFMYNSDGQKVQASSRKSPLTQRVGMPQSQSYVSNSQTTGVKPGLPQTVTPGTPPVNTIPHQQVFSCPPTVDSVSSEERATEAKVQGDDEPKVLSDDIRETSMAKLSGVLKQCEGKVKARVADDVKKRMDVLNVAWKTNKLSSVVQRRMAELATALTEREYDVAHGVHLSLMVDYVSEVSQWMVGIKRLIMEARSILPHPPPPPPSSETKDEEETEQITSSNQGFTGDETKQQGDTTESSGDGTKQPADSVHGSCLEPVSSSAAKDADSPQNNDTNQVTSKAETEQSTSKHGEHSDDESQSHQI